MEHNDISGDTARDGIVLIPTYNEKENAAAIIDAVMALPRAFDVLVIDDGRLTAPPTSCAGSRRHIPVVST